MTRSPDRVLVRWVVVALLLAQWAIASHACGLTGSVAPAGTESLIVSSGLSSARAAPESASMQMADCDEMKSVAAYGEDVLCAEHCKFGDQRDAAAAVVIFSGFPPLAHAGQSTDDAALIQPILQSRLGALRLSPPPHAILHCVRRT